MTTPSIDALETTDFELFIEYMNEHVSDNGKAGTGYFQPLSQGDSVFSVERATTFLDALAIPVGTPGWRRAWILRSGERIIGHVDLRSHPERFAEHRCLLGMGVDRHHRRLGMGRALVEHARHWATLDARLEWIELQVLSENQPAIALYLRSGFIRVGEVPEMFMIDGRRFSHTTMTMQLNAGRES